jgi:hypothetical protein
MEQADRAGITAMDAGEAGDPTQEIVDAIVQHLDESAGSA